MRQFINRLFCFFIAGTISFCATISPAYALVTSFAGLPSINAIINGTVGTFTSTSTGVTITRASVAIADGVSIPFTIAEAATFGEVAAGGVAAALASPIGLAAGIVIAAAVLYGWHKCFTAPSGWCKSTTGTVTQGGWRLFGSGVNYGTYEQAGASFAATQGSSYSYRAYPGRPHDFSPCTPNPNPCVDETAYVELTYSDGSSVGLGPQALTHYNISTTTTTTDADQATDPVHSPEAQSLTQRAMAENRLRAVDLAQAAQTDGHPVDDPAVNPRLPTTVSSPDTATAPTTKVETAPDGTKTTTTCTGAATLGISPGDNTTATLTKGSTSNCTVVAVAPDGTTKTSTTTNTDGQKSTPTAGPVECGSPGKPKCAIDETGTPTDATTTGTAVATTITATKDAATTAIGTEQAADHKPATRWQFSFTLPSQCTPFSMFLGIVLDYCRFQPIIHDVMSMVWYGTTFFTIAGMFGRAAREG